MPEGIIYVILNQFPSCRCVVSNAARNTNTRTAHLVARDQPSNTDLWTASVVGNNAQLELIISKVGINQIHL